MSRWIPCWFMMILVVILQCPIFAQQEWSRFRGPTGMGISDESQLPLQWSSKEKIVWKLPLPGAGASSPIVFRNRIYLTSYSDYYVPGESGGEIEKLKRHLIAVDREGGSILWDKVIPAKLPEEAKIRDHGFAANTPVADESGIYVFFGKSGVFAFDEKGSQRWVADVGDRTHGWGTSASPVIWSNLLFINASVESESLYALDKTNGKVVWQAKGIKEAWNTPLVVRSATGKDELIIATQGDVLAFDPATGERLWSCKTDIGWYMVPSVISHEGMIYCLGGRSGNAALAIRSGGRGDVTATHRVWVSQKGSNVSSPVYFQGALYWMHEQRGIAYCAKADTGEILYEERLNRAGQVYASALLAGNRVYYLTREGQIFVLAAKPQFEQLAVNDLRDGGVFDASPVVDGKRLLIRSTKFLYSVGEK